MTDLPPIEYSFPEQISYTSHSMFRQCPQKWFYAYCSGFRKKMDKSVDLVAGAAFAAGLEAARKAHYDEGADPTDAALVGIEALIEAYGEDAWPEHTKNRQAMMGALYAYFTQWPLASDYLKPMPSPAGSGIEFKFAYPLPIQHPALDQPLLYGGRLDMLAQYRDTGTLWTVDDKTASSLGPRWKNKFRLDSQGTSYVWAAQQHGYTVAGFIVRGTSILKRSYGHEEAYNPRSKWQIDDWYEQLLRDVQRMKFTYLHALGQSWDDIPLMKERPDRALTQDACGAFGGCPFLDACGSPNGEAWLRAAMVDPNDQGPIDAAALAELFA